MQSRQLICHPALEEVTLHAGRGVGYIAATCAATARHVGHVRAGQQRHAILSGSGRGWCAGQLLLSSPSILGRTSIVLGSAQRLYVGQNCTISLLGLGGHSYAILDESRTVQRHRPSAAQVEEGSVVCHHAKTSGLSRCAQNFWQVLAAHIDTVPFVHWWAAETPGEHDCIVEEW